MDQLYEKLAPVSPVKLAMEPSAYFRRQCYATFIEDPFFDATVPAMGSENIMWSSDFPHLASSFPRSHEVIAEHLGGLAADDLDRIVRANVARLYGIGRP